MRLEEALSEASCLNALICRTKCACASCRVQSVSVAKLVNLQIAGIFKRILESWNPAQNAKKFAKSGGRKIWIARVYHTGVKHDTALRETNGLLTCGCVSNRARRVPKGRDPYNARYPSPQPSPNGRGSPVATVEKASPLPFRIRLRVLCVAMTAAEAFSSGPSLPPPAFRGP